MFIRLSGLILIGMTMISVGVFCSAVTDKQVIAQCDDRDTGAVLVCRGGIGGHTENISNIMRSFRCSAILRICTADSLIRGHRVLFIVYCCRLFLFTQGA